MTQVAALSEKRLHRLLDARFSGLPEQLAADDAVGGSGLVSLHKSVVGLCAENRLLASPASIHAADTSSGQEDFQAFTGLAAGKLATPARQRRARPGLRTGRRPPGGRARRSIGAAAAAARARAPRRPARTRHGRSITGPDRGGGASHPARWRSGSRWWPDGAVRVNSGEGTCGRPAGTRRGGHATAPTTTRRRDPGEEHGPREPPDRRAALRQDRAARVRSPGGRRRDVHPAGRFHRHCLRGQPRPARGGRPSADRGTEAGRHDPRRSGSAIGGARPRHT